MRKNTMTATASAALAVWLGTAALAQEGYPLDGTWRGAWGTGSGDGDAVVIVMEWDGEHINGTINPGPRSYAFSRAELDPRTWTVRIEAESPELGLVVIEGTLEDIGSYNRYIEGTWMHGGERHPFKMARE